MLSLVLAAVLSASAALGPGQLAQPAGEAGCISQEAEDGCRGGTGLTGPKGVAVSPDGANLYVASEGGSGTVASFERELSSGTLTELGCLSDAGTGGCEDGRSLSGAAAVAVSPDGENVYVASRLAGAIAVFDRDPATGALTQLQGLAGCVSEDGSGGTCADGRGLLQPEDLAVSPDGANLYVASQGSDAVAAFRRTPATGALTQLTGTSGCVSETGSGGQCGDGKALLGAAGLVVSPDGKSVYVSANRANAVASFGRTAGGALTQVPGAAGCVSEDGSGGQCRDGERLRGAAGIAISPDGANVYLAAAISDALTSFDRDPASGALTQPPEDPGCAPTCQDRSALGEAFDVAVSPDGTSVYVAATGSSAVATFDRDPATHELSQPVGEAGCIAEHGFLDGTCTPARGLTGATAVALDPDGANVYVGSHIAGALATLERAAPGTEEPPFEEPPAEEPPAVPRPGGPTPPPSTPPPADTTAPRLSGLKLPRLQVPAARGSAPRIRFTLSESATVRIAIVCAPRPGAGATRPAKVGTLTLKGRAGANALAFAGKVGGRSLSPGAYRASAVATDAAGNRSAPATAPFAVTGAAR